MVRFAANVGLGSLLLACQASGGIAVSEATIAPVASPTSLPEQAEAPIDLTKASAAGMTTAQLVRRLLDPSDVAEITHHELQESAFADGYLGGVRFFARPLPLGSDMCRRNTSYVALKPVGGRTADNVRNDVPVIKEQVIQNEQIVLAPGCRLKPNAFFAWVQDARFDEGANALRRLATLQRKARAQGRLGAVVQCASEFHPKACDKGARTVLAGLPLDRIYIINQRRLSEGGGWEFSVMPQGPGQIYWKVDVEEPSGKPPVIRLDWRIPAPF